MTTDEVMKIVEAETGHLISLDMQVKDLGLDSLEFLELMLQLSIPDASVPYIETVRDLCRVATAQ